MHLSQRAPTLGSSIAVLGVEDFGVNCTAMVGAQSNGVLEQRFRFSESLPSIGQEVALILRVNIDVHRFKFQFDVMVTIFVRLDLGDFFDQSCLSDVHFAEICHCGTHASLCCFDLHRAVIGQLNHAPNLVEAEIRNSLKTFRSSLGCLRVSFKRIGCLRTYVLKIGTGKFDCNACGSSLPKCALKFRDRAGCEKAGSYGVVTFLLSALIFRNPQCNARRSKCAKCNQCINWYADCSPKIFRIDVRVKYRDGDASCRQIANSDQQRDECKVSGFPRAFHDFPVFDFRAIVARPAEGV